MPRSQHYFHLYEVAQMHGVTTGGDTLLCAMTSRLPVYRSDDRAADEVAW